MRLGCFILMWFWGNLKAQQDIHLKWNFHSTDPYLNIDVCKFYVGNFVFYNHGIEVGRAEDYFLMERLKREELVFHECINTGFDAFEFQLGVDSITHERGVMMGDLDPVQNMYWTWQAGYIDAKIEGKWKEHPFQLHLGGYQHPYRADQKVRVSCSKVQYEYHFDSFLDIGFIQRLNEAMGDNGCLIMSPRTEAVEWMQWIAKKMMEH